MEVTRQGPTRSAPWRQISYDRDPCMFIHDLVCFRKRSCWVITTQPYLLAKPPTTSLKTVKQSRASA
jgi:hypothetical protein